MIKYRFFLQFNEGGERFPVFPVMNDNQSIELSRENESRFYRAKLTDKIIFLGKDYDKIMSAPFDTEYILTLEITKDSGRTFTPYLYGHFFRTDCTINNANKNIKVQPLTYDAYNKIISSMEKEMDILKQPIQTTPITAAKRPMLQIYVPGDNILTCYFGGVQFEQDVVNPVLNYNDIRNKYHFAFVDWVAEIYVKSFPYIPTFEGVYTGNLTLPEGAQLLVGELQKYPRLKDFKLKVFTPDFIGGNSTIQFEDINTGDVMYKYVGRLDKGFNDITMQPQPGYVGSVEAVVRLSPLYARYMLDVETLNGKATNEIPADDIVTNNRNYRRVIGFALDICTISNRLSDEVTEWGQNEIGKYYLPPYAAFDTHYYPLSRSIWRYASLWFSTPVEYDNLEVKAKKDYIIPDCYAVSAVLKTLLNKYCSNIKHEPTPEYSEFLYGPTNPISGDTFRLFVSPKSNIIEGEYQTPAQKAKTTLMQFLKMLQNAFKLYWFIDGDKLRIEHIKWFKNGGSYGGIPAIGYDLTKMINTRNGKSWAFNAEEYTYDLEKMPERYTFSWMDDVTDAFEGHPIEMISRYVEEGKIEEVTISGFTSDFDYIVLNPEAVNKDGFALLAAVSEGGRYKLPFVQMNVANRRYVLQNGYVSNLYLLPMFWTYDLPGRRAKVNEEEIIANGIARNKSQNVTIPIGKTEPDPINLVKTNIGNGEIEKISINLQSRTAKTTLKYETE